MSKQLMGKNKMLKLLLKEYHHQQMVKLDRIDSKNLQDKTEVEVKLMLQRTANLLIKNHERRNRGYKNLE